MLLVVWETRLRHYQDLAGEGFLLLVESKARFRIGKDSVFGVLYLYDLLALYE